MVSSSMHHDHDHDHDDALRERSESMLMTRKDKDMILKAKREDMKIIFTCPICNNLFDHSTTISECLHTFCRKCIQKKLVQEKLRACPVCKVDLGPYPLDKLRYDRSLEDLRLKVFKPKPKIKKASPKTTVKKCFRKKNRFLSSRLVTPCIIPDSTPDDAPMEPEKLGEQLKVVVSLIATSSRPVLTFRKRQRKNPKPKRNEPEQLHQERENGFEIVFNNEQDNGLTGEAGTSQGCIQIRGNNSDNLLGKSLSIGKKAASLKINEDTAMIVERTISKKEKEKQDYVEASVEEKHKSVLKPRAKTEEKMNQNIVLVVSDSDKEKPENNVEENQENVLNSRKIRGAKLKGKAYSLPVLRQRRKRNMNFACISMKLENKLAGSNSPVWFSLVAVVNQNKPLPQISPLYLRVTNGDLSVSYVKKYLVKKLNLQSEEEVEIWLRQEPVCSTQKLYDLVKWWVHTTPMAERKSAVVGSSAAEFVMVLNYSRSQPFASF